MFVIGILAAGVGACFIGVWVFDLRKAIRGKGWPCIKGEVLKSEIGKTYLHDPGPPSYFVKVSYEYEIKGERYESNRFSFFTRDYENLNKDEADYAQRGTLSEGKQVIVYYDPDKPTFAVLDRGLDSYFPWVGLFFFLFGSVVVAADFPKYDFFS